MALTTITISADAAAGGTTQAPVYIGTTAPAVPAHGSLWWNSETGRMYLYYVDANSSQWVSLSLLEQPATYTL